ncbi:hypothetical protein H8959_015595 [Pygathrix nigripes]
MPFSSVKRTEAELRDCTSGTTGRKEMVGCLTEKVRHRREPEEPKRGAWASGLQESSGLAGVLGWGMEVAGEEGRFSC